jgi:hypothetical protein
VGERGEGVKYLIDKNYYVKRKKDLLKEFEKDVKRWSPFLLKEYAEIQTYRIMLTAREEFEKLISQIPYIGGNENAFTKNLVDSVRYLALYKAMKNYDFNVIEIGKIIYEGYLKKASEPLNIPKDKWLTPEQRLEQSKQGAMRSQEKHYPGDYVYTFVPGDGKKFDHGFDFTECASQKLYHVHGADELLPYYCYLDFVAAEVRDFGFTRTMTLWEGHGRCNHRFKAGRKTKAGWPPPFVKGNK